MDTESTRAGVRAVALASALLLTACGGDDSSSDSATTVTPPATLTVSPTTPPQALAGTTPPPGGDHFGPGTYFVDEVGGSPTPRITVTLSDGWVSFKPGNSVGIYKEGAGTFSFMRPTGVYKDACHWENGLVEGPLTTLDDLVAAFSEQGGWIDVTPPSDVSVDGYPGKTFQHTSPAETRGCSAFRSWTDDGGTQYDYLADDIETLYFLDVNGTVIGFDTVMLPGDHDANAAAELAALVDSIRIEPT